LQLEKWNYHIADDKWMFSDLFLPIFEAKT